MTFRSPKKRPTTARTEKNSLNMLLDELLHLKPQFQTLMTRYGATRLRVFGSVARGEENEESVVDFLVELPRGYDLFSQRLPLVSGLQDIVKQKIDLIPEHEHNEHLRDQILKEAISL